MNLDLHIVNGSYAGPVDIRRLNLVTIEHAYVIAPSGARPSTGTVLAIELEISSSKLLLQVMI